MAKIYNITTKESDSYVEISRFLSLRTFFLKYPLFSLLLFTYDISRLLYKICISLRIF